MLDGSTIIKDLKQEDVYKYLGVDESNGVQYAQIKEKVRKEYYSRAQVILRTELNLQIA